MAATNGTNSTGTDDGGHGLLSSLTPQIIILMILFSCLILLNGLVVTTIFGTSRLRRCWLSVYTATSCIGNILGATSFFANHFYDLHDEQVISNERVWNDEYFFLYFGTAMNVVIMIFYTHFRYERVTSMKNNNRLSSTLSKNNNNNRIRCAVCCRVVIACLTSILLATLGTVARKHLEAKYRFVVSLGICLPPISVTIVWNVLLGIFLKRNRERLQSNTSSSSNKTHSNREARSNNNIDRATVIIAVTIVVHVMFLLLFGVGTLLVFLVFRRAATCNSCYRSITSLLGVAYFVLFSVEAIVYLYKFAVARKVILKKISTISRSVSRRVPTVNKRKIKTEEVTGGGGDGLNDGGGGGDGGGLNDGCVGGDGGGGGSGSVDNGGYEYNVVGGLASGRTPKMVITNLATVKNVDVDEP